MWHHRKVPTLISYFALLIIAIVAYATLNLVRQQQQIGSKAASNAPSTLPISLLLAQVQSQNQDADISLQDVDNSINDSQKDNDSLQVNLTPASNPLQNLRQSALSLISERLIAL